jgi:autotransporter-associated beta strand protein
MTLASWGGTITVLSGTATIDSTIAGGGSGLAETGAGMLVLDGTLAYAGATTVAGGTLDLMSPPAAAPVIAGGRAIGPPAPSSARMALRLCTTSIRPCSASCKACSSIRLSIART